ncbi:MAG: LysR family transcriptional regulator [Bacteroidales bacterium]|nr:LysR family transcriptional regulator [Bacteroidales bacterium]
MTDNRLKIFCTTADRLSFSAAAKTLGITQPAVTKQIAKLEEELGYALFIRISKKVILTEKGSEFLKIAQEILEKYREIDKI